MANYSRANKYVTATWATHVDMDTGRPVEDPAYDYSDETKWILPGPLGGHNWQAMAFDEKRRLAFYSSDGKSIIVFHG